MTPGDARDSMEPTDGMAACEDVLAALARGDEAELRELAESRADFPDGEDPWLGRRWINHAIDAAPQTAIAWLIGRGVALNFKDAEGYPPLFTTIDSEREDRLEVLRLLLSSGASPATRGINDWTALHLAAARNDVAALELLLEFGADPSARTGIDERHTPLEEAQSLGAAETAAVLEQRRS